MATRAVADPKRPSTTKKPTSRQWWRIAQESLRLLRLDAPTTRAEAHALISRLAEARAYRESDDCPF